MHYTDNDDLYCYLNDELVTRNQVCKSMCNANNDTIFYIYFPLGFFSVMILLFKLIYYIRKRDKISVKKNIGLQCDFSSIHHVVIEPDNSLSIICDDC